jgi:hypothetical protein
VREREREGKIAEFSISGKAWRSGKSNGNFDPLLVAKRRRDEGAGEDYEA